MGTRTAFRTVRLSLADLLGTDYVDAVASARASVTGLPVGPLRSLGRRKVDFLPKDFQGRLVALLRRMGSPLAARATRLAVGAASRAFQAAGKAAMAPLTGWGYYRVGEDGLLYFLAKSEHYHAPLGHSFPGYLLIEHARRLGIPNATHNNTRGHVTRLLEEEIVRTINGLQRGDTASLAGTVRSRRAGVLNRVLNLQTGSLAVEAGIKMMLARFYKVQADSSGPKHTGRTPVFVVIGDEAGGVSANYHGTTVLAQMMRGMWPELEGGLAKHRLMKIVPVRPNDCSHLETVFEKYERGPTKIAGLLHEIVLMNYRGLLLSRNFVKRMYALCRRHDVPVLADEIQSCLWSPELYMFREYGVRPTFAVIGKGFSGGEYAAARIAFHAAMDCLPQFGALVTNGQEELASLAYLITMRWAEVNADRTGAVGDEYQGRLRDLVAKYPEHVAAVDGRRHLASLVFHDLGRAKAFTRRLVDGGLDISVQTYKKQQCPPAAMTKLPLIAGREAVDMVISRMAEALAQL